MSEVERHLFSPGPKRILALDGGGIKGVLTLEFLERIEQLLRERYHNPSLLLCEYFDIIAGTSTGAIIGSMLAMGKSATEIKEFYLRLGPLVVKKKYWRPWQYTFDASALQAELKKVFGDMTLGDSRLRTGLIVVTKRADTGSTWPFFNNPRAKYFDSNKDYKLNEIVRASTAAPTMFIPQRIEIAPGVFGAFVDGSVSMSTNPSFQALLMATLKGYNVGWKLGRDNIMLVSVGTGYWRRREMVDTVINEKLWNWAKQVPMMLIDDSSKFIQLLLQWMAATETGITIDSEIGDLSGDDMDSLKFLRYVRYNVDVTEETLRDLGMDDLIPKIQQLSEMQRAENRYDLSRLGDKAASVKVKEEHFHESFDIVVRVTEKVVQTTTETVTDSDGHRVTTTTTTTSEAVVETDIHVEVDRDDESAAKVQATDDLEDPSTSE